MRAEKPLLVASPLDQSRYCSDVPSALFTSPLTLVHEDSETACTSDQTSSCDVGNGQFEGR